MFFNLFKKKDKQGSIFEKEFPKHEFKWNEPWWPLKESKRSRAGIQRELNLEIGPQHPLWDLQPIAFGKTDANDDVLVFLSDGRFACVHLIWHGKIDQYPDKYPSFLFLDTPVKVQEFLDNEAEECT